MLENIREVQDLLSDLNVDKKVDYHRIVEQNKTPNELLLEIQDIFDKFLSDLIMLCDDKNTSFEDLKDMLQNDSTEKETITENCEILSHHLEYIDGTKDMLEKEVRKLESIENWKLYDSLK